MKKTDFGAFDMDDFLKARFTVHELLPPDHVLVVPGEAINEKL